MSSSISPFNLKQLIKASGPDPKNIIIAKRNSVITNVIKDKMNHNLEKNKSLITK
jgi:hypothetical protein